MSFSRKKTVKPGEENDSASAFDAACRILSFMDNTEKMLDRKLAERGFTPAARADAIDRVKRMGFLEEERMILRKVESLAKNHGYGWKRIRQELALAGFSEEAYDALTPEFLASLDFPAICAGLLRKKGGEPDEKTYAFLLRRGFSGEDIRKAKQLLKEEQE
ncbi:MAG: recombination regulator RecX [Lachnospiraceae bacterium]|nr:recombination regulator RecX [Lachnospiraceae bacterium]